MTRLTTTLFSSIIAAGGIGAASAAQPDVDRALQAMGGPGASQIQTIVVQGRTRHLEPDQSYKPDGEYRLCDEATFTESRDLGTGKTRIEWYRKMVYPAPREYKFTEVVADGIGWVNGIDSTARTKQSLSMNQHAMSGLRVAASTRELARSSPMLIADMQRQPTRVT